MNIFAYTRNSFLKFFGDLKVFKFPFFLLYDPGSYKLKGHEVRKVIDTVQKGDILIRGYSNYLDGFFIPGFFSHAALYIGETKESDLILPDIVKEKFYTGKQVVIHAMAEGVFMEDIINFCKCDYLIILRRNKNIEPELDLDESFKIVAKKALKNLGKNYDFKFDFSDIGNLSCTEFVYICNDDYINNYDVKIKTRRVFFKKRVMLLPDDFVTKKFETVFTSNSINMEKVNEIMNKNEIIEK